MFSGCRELTQAPPVLPATTLKSGCYNSMFRNCVSLAKAPDLPATTLADSCYFNMFFGCKKLNYVKALFTTILSTGYINGWLYDVSPTGTFIKSKDATWTNTNEQVKIPSGWTVETV